MLLKTGVHFENHAELKQVVDSEIFSLYLIENILRLRYKDKRVNFVNVLFVLRTLQSQSRW
jgi:hypothetical protein